MHWTDQHIGIIGETEDGQPIYAAYGEAEQVLEVGLNRDHIVTYLEMYAFRLLSPENVHELYCLSIQLREFPEYTFEGLFGEERRRRLRKDAL